MRVRLLKDGYESEVDDAVGQSMIDGGLAEKVVDASDPERSFRDDPLPHELSQNRGRYNLGRAIQRCAATNRLDGIEAEVSQELARRTGRRIGASGRDIRFFVPWNAPVARRSFDTSAGAGGIPVILGQLIDVLRSKLVLAQLGCQVIPDLRGGQFAMPRKSATTSLGWLAEGGEPSLASPKVDQQILFAPKTTGGITAVTRRAIDSIPGAEDLVVTDLIAAIAVEIATAAVNGQGNNTSLDPLGLLQNPSIAIASAGTNGAAPTRNLIVSMETTVGNANADIGMLGWLTSPNARSVLRRTDNATASGRFVWTDENRVLGYPAFASNVVPSNLDKGTTTNNTLSALLYGNWMDLLIGLWGPATVIVNPYTLSTAGYVQISALQDVDVNVRHPESFIKCADLVTS
jgi:HK97 family phage major capsid protein